MKNILLLFSLFIPAALFSQGIIKGTVTDESNQPVPGATVQIESLAMGTLTDMNGHYQLNDLESGSWKVSFRTLGFQTVTRTINLAEGATATLNVVLREEYNNLEEVVVSASRNSEFLSEIPASVTVVGIEQLGSFSKTTSNVNEILEFTVPGLAPSSGTFSNWGQTLRGRSLLVMIDGIPQSTPLRNGLLGMKSVNPNDISRVEVIKGATSIFGNGGNGGFINYITKNPDAGKPIEGSTNLWGTANAAESEDALGWGIYQSLKGNLDKVSYYLSASLEQTGNKYDADGVPLLPTYGTDNTKIYSTFGKITYPISENQELTLNGNLYKSAQDSPFIPQLGSVEVLDEEGNYILEPGIGVEGNIPGQEPTGTTLINGRIKYELKGIFARTTDFAADIYYQKAKNVFFYSNAFEGGGQSVINAEKYGIRPNFHTQFTPGQKADISFTYGLDVLRDKTNQGLLDGRLWVPNTEMKSWAPYLQSTLKLDNEWVVKAGLRYDAMRIGIDDYNTLPYSPRQDGVFNPSVAVKGGVLEFDNTAFNIGVRYIRNNAFIPYISYSQGFSIADLGSVLRSAVAEDINDINLKPAVTNNYEFGFLSKFNNIRFEAVGYYSTSNLGTGVVFNEDTNSFVPSVQPQNIYGGEVSIDVVTLMNKLMVGTSYSYVEGFKSSLTDKNDLSYLGGDVISAPKLTAYATWYPAEKWSTTLRMIHISDRDRFNPFLNDNDQWAYRHTEFPVEGYTLLNFLATFDVRADMRLSLSVNNLLNEYYLPARSQWAAPLRTFTGVGEGANARIGLTYNF